MILKNESAFAPISSEVLKDLQETFPKKDFGADTNMNQLMFHYGQRSVVNFLTAKFNEQNETILTKD